MTREPDEQHPPATPTQEEIEDARRDLETMRQARRRGDPLGPLVVQYLAAVRAWPTVGGVVSRELPAKTHPASDLGDAFAYMVGGIVPGRVAASRHRERPMPAGSANSWMGA